MIQVLHARGKYDLQGRDVTHDDVKDAILQLTVTEHYYTGVQDLVTLLCEFNDISVKVFQQPCDCMYCRAELHVAQALHCMTLVYVLRETSCICIAH